MSSPAGDPIPLVDLAAAHREVAEEIHEGFDRVLTKTAFILGPDVAAFEAEFAAWTGTAHCIGVSNGTDALELAMRAGGIGPGDEVLLPVNTFFATAASVFRAGARPVFVDCDPVHLLMDPAQAAARASERSRALVPVHLFGQMAPMDPLLELASERGLSVYEDFAQAQGARQGDRTAGASSLAAGTSFYPGKNIGAYGDAGAVVTDDAAIAEAVRSLRNWGSTQKYVHPSIGFNCRLDTLQAVVLRAKLRRLADWNEARRRAAARYDALLGDLEAVSPVPTAPGNTHVYHLYVVQLQGPSGTRDRVLADLQSQGIGAGIHYPQALHTTPAFAELGYREGDFPVSEAAAERILSLPLYPQITGEQQERVVAALRSALEGA